MDSTMYYDVSDALRSPMMSRERRTDPDGSTVVGTIYDIRGRPPYGWPACAAPCSSP